MKHIITKGIDQIDSDLWATVSQGHPYAGESWCRYGENVLSAPGYYVIVLDDTGRAIAGACFYILHNDFLPINNPFLRRAVMWYLERYPMVVARTAYGTNYKGIFLPSDPTKQEEALHHILEAGKQITRENRGSFLICDYLEDDDLNHDWEDFTKLNDFLDVGTLLYTEDYNSFDDYMRDLRQKKGKRPPKEVRRHSRKAIAQGMQVSFQKDLPELQKAIDLIDTVGSKYDDDLIRPFTREIIESSATLPTDNAFWMIACIEQEIIACELILFDSESGVCTPSLFGRDQSIDFSYFYSFYEVIRYGIENLSAKKIIGGSTKEHFKLRKGYEPDFRNHFAVYMPSMLNRAIANILMSILDHQETSATDGPSAEND